MTGAEARLLRFLHAASRHTTWVSDRTIRNTEELLSGDERAIPTLVSRGLVEKKISEPAYRVTERGLKALGQGGIGRS